MSWSIADSRNMYGIRHWGAGYYDIGDNGHVSVHPHGKYDETALDIYALTQDLRAKGLALPLLRAIINSLASSPSGRGRPCYTGLRLPWTGHPAWITSRRRRPRPRMRTTR